MVTDIKRYRSERNKKKNISFLNKFLFQILKVILIISILIAILVFTPFFKVVDVQLSGIYYLDRDSLEDQINDILGQNIVFLKKGEIRDSFLSISYIEDIEIQRKFPNKLEISILERTPVALLVTNDGFIQISRDAIFLDIRQTPKDYSLPLITGVELYAIPGVGKKIESSALNEVLQIVTISNPTFMSKIAELNIENERIIAYTRNGVTVLLGGAEDIENKVKILEGILEDIVNVTISVDEIEYIDLRFKGTYVIKRIQD